MSVDPVVFAKAIADPTRQAIMTELCCVWCSVGELVEKLGGRVGQPTVSHHLKVLEEAGLVVSRPDGRHRFYSLNQAEVTACCGGLMRSFAPDFSAAFIRLDSIEGL